MLRCVRSMLCYVVSKVQYIHVDRNTGLLSVRVFWVGCGTLVWSGVVNRWV